jgi:hypothetical protein
LKGGERNEIMNLLTLFLSSKPYQNPDNTSYISRQNVLETPIFFELSGERRFHILLRFLRFLTTKSINIVQLAKIVAAHPFIEPEMACGISIGIARKEVKDWTNMNHKKYWNP